MPILVYVRGGGASVKVSSNAVVLPGPPPGRPSHPAISAISAVVLEGSSEATKLKGREGVVVLKRPNARAQKT